MKKQLLSAAALFVFGLSTSFAQNNVIVGSKNVTKAGAEQQHFTRCASPIPTAEWDTEFNKLVDKYIKERTDVSTGKISTIPAVIPVVVHVIHNQNSITLENITAAQVASQIAVLNADFAGTNTDISSVPSIFTASKAGDTQIQFCLAVTDPTGNPMSEPGIHRQKWNTISGATDPNLAADGASLQNLFNNTIKPNTIWDPTKYMNIWVAKMNGSGLLGYASWPAASTLTGLGTVETAQTSGVVINCYAFGTTGIAGTSGYSVYNKGRTATHEIGHWLGLRHISGDDATCSVNNDFCLDTPKQKGGYNGGTPDPTGQGGLNYGCPTYPYLAASECTGANSATTAGSEMFMNYMDYVDDACMYLFTTNQKTRMQTAMTNGTYRKLLGTHGLCSSSPTAPVAAFTMSSSGCTNMAVSTSNSTTGNPTPTYAWSSSPSTGVTISNATATSPTITFANTGTYTVTLVATNSQGSQNATQVISITNCTMTQCDTLNNIPDTSNLVLYTTGGGYLSGNNQYGDTHKGEYFTQTGISGNKVTGVIVYFYKNGNNGTGGTAGNNMAFQLYAGNNTAGPTGAAVKSDNVTLGTLATGGIQSGTVLAYTHTFSTAYTLTANEFHAAVQLPTTAGDTVALYSRLLNVPTTNTAWEKQSNGTWYPYNSGSAWGQTGAITLFPIVCPNSIGLAASSLNTQIAIYPNPSTGIINFAFALTNQSDVKIEVTNILGQTVYSSFEKAVSADVKSINIGDVSKGVYMVTVSTSTEKLVRKIVIE